MKRIFKIENIKEIVEEIINKIYKKNTNKATIIAMYGDLGVGKTTLTREIAKQMGIKVKIVSPTFVIMKTYKVKNKKFKQLIHIDAYRLESEEELFKIGWADIIKDKDNLVIVEWPENVINCIPENSHKIQIEHKSEDTRSLKICYN